MVYNLVFEEQDIEIHCPGAFVDDPYPAELVLYGLEVVEQIYWVQDC